MTMAGRMSIFLFITLATMAGCQSIALHMKPVPEDEGEVFIYASPFAQEADRLRFSLEGIAAMREDGVELPLG